jgi:hypothetical protein
MSGMPVGTIKYASASLPAAEHIKTNLIKGIGNTRAILATD